MQCVVYVGGHIVKWYNGRKKDCMIYMQGAAEGLEASGARLNFTVDESNPGGIWSGNNHVGKPVVVFIWEGK